MAFEDLKDQLNENVQTLWAKLQENSQFIELMERYSSLQPAAQKGIIAGVVAVCMLVIFMIPWGWFSSSSDKIQEFEDQKALIQDMFQVKRDSSILTTAPRKIPPEELISAVQGQLQTARLSAEQIKSVQNYDNTTGRPSTVIPKNVEQYGASVTLSKLNLRQIVDIGYMVQTITSGVKMVGIDIQASSDDPRYFDVTYKLVNFSVAEPPPKPIGNGRPKGGRRPPPNDSKEDSAEEE